MASADNNAKTDQEKFWAGTFGKEYTDRNSRDHASWNEHFLATRGITKLEMNEQFLGSLPKDIRILEVGCNTGMQLVGLQKMGFTNLYGVELQRYAVEKSKEYTKDINIIQGSAFDLPFKDGFFDLVFTDGVLIHISPDDLPAFMAEMHRCTNRYIWGYEYFAEAMQAIKYRGNENTLWKADYAQVFANQFSDMKLLQLQKFPYLNDNNIDAMYLLEKIQTV